MTDSEKRSSLLRYKLITPVKGFIEQAPVGTQHGKTSANRTKLWAEFSTLGSGVLVHVVPGKPY